MTISKRLLILMGAAVVAMLIIVAVAIIEMGKVYKEANFGNENVVPSILILDTALMEFSHVRVSVYGHILNSDTKAKANLAARMREAENVVNEHLKEYEPLVVDAEDKRLLDENNKYFAEYMKSLKPLLEASERNARDEVLALLPGAGKAAEAFNSALVTCRGIFGPPET